MFLNFQRFTFHKQGKKVLVEGTEMFGRPLQFFVVNDSSRTRENLAGTLQDGAPKIAKLHFNLLNYDLW